MYLCNSVINIMTAHRPRRVDVIMPWIAFYSKISPSVCAVCVEEDMS